MIKKKVCMLGAFSVGKTSLVKRFVQSIFTEKYQTTIGVKIDKKAVVLDNTEVDLVLWDLPGKDDFQDIKQTYLQGASGYLLVIDGTRKTTFDIGFEIQEKVNNLIGDIPFVLVINKTDLITEWTFKDDVITELTQKGITVYKTSAKTGENVEEIFTALAKKMIES